MVTFHSVGNAAFHSNELYKHFVSSLSPLAISLDDVDEKTRANAAGALGNLVRNGGDIEREIAAERIVEKLMKMTLVDRDISPQVCVSFVCILMFSLHFELMFLTDCYFIY